VSITTDGSRLSSSSILVDEFVGILQPIGSDIWRLTGDGRPDLTVLGRPRRRLVLAMLAPSAERLRWRRDVPRLFWYRSSFTSNWLLTRWLCSQRGEPNDGALGDLCGFGPSRRSSCLMDTFCWIYKTHTVSCGYHIKELTSVPYLKNTNSLCFQSQVTWLVVAEVGSTSFGLVLHVQHVVANSFNFLVTWRLTVTVFHSRCNFVWMHSDLAFLSFRELLFSSHSVVPICLHFSTDCHYEPPSTDFHHHASWKLLNYLTTGTEATTSDISNQHPTNCYQATMQTIFIGQTTATIQLRRLHYVCIPDCLCLHSVSESDPRSSYELCS